MKNIRVELGDRRSYDILIGKGSVKHIFENAPAGRKLFVFDDRTMELFGREFAAAGEICYSFGHGENAKTMDSVLNICRAALKANLDRSGTFVAVGGGVTGDLTGFASGIYLRGADCIQIPTSLLAMVDSSVGGKTAADLPEGKNLVGVFHQPAKVIIDTDFLKYLPVRELRNGLAEVVKMAAGFDVGFFEMLEKAGAAISEYEGFCAVAEYAVCRCCELKAAVVAEDECEDASGIRAQLNFGHTFGHAVESACNFKMSHGECVSVGMVLAGIAAIKRNMWSVAEQKRLVTLLEQLGLPVTIPEELTFEMILPPMLHDKKNAGGKVTLILPCCLGKLTRVRDFDEAELREIWTAGGGR